eukprot:7817881-Alexandrium_andersonii.AAC.1
MAKIIAEQRVADAKAEEAVLEKQWKDSLLLLQHVAQVREGMCVRVETCPKQSRCCSHLSCSVCAPWVARVVLE